MKARSLMIIPQFRPILGGAELQAERLAIRLSTLGYQINVVTELQSFDDPPYQVIDGVEVTRVNFKMPIEASEGSERLFQYLVKHRTAYDILHSHLAFGHAVVAIVAAKVLGKKSIVKVACAGKYGDLETLSRLANGHLAVEILKKADKMIAISREVEKELLSWGFLPHKIQRIPNGVDTSLFVRTKPFPPRKPFIFTLIGRRTHQKGIDVLLKAIRKLTNLTKQQFQVHFYGREDDRYDYLKLSKELGVDSFVRFLPFSNEVRNILDKTHCLVLPSRGEGMSNVLLEAMSYGVPVIATRVSGTMDIVEHQKDGLLIAVNSEKQLAEAMLSILQDFEWATQLGQAARKKVHQHFSLDNIASQYSTLYKDLAE